MDIVGYLWISLDILGYSNGAPVDGFKIRQRAPWCVTHTMSLPRGVERFVMVHRRTWTAGTCARSYSQDDLTIGSVWPGGSGPARA